ncbi:MAG TPA: hypothetical protein DCE43_09700 [Planctomycetaceae bacterium]|jgi:hypothetical protein|nr:hypothetical protein [Planctomycetaceae bacterium]HAA49985.1 hypothetical protein [Planctomycetaceae bacterium]HCK54378.1 hypothetical protein [Planctomycetaceae bacterium]|tara:strand:- start:36 stop:476 length:441 start_codon:yes stop_codon:yes gene_type:complete
MAWYHSGHGRPINTVVRLLLVAWGVFLLGGFSLAFRLTPNPAGFGTHQQLGLPPCSFQTMFGVPCPSCGMTTSFSHFVRGQWILSARSNVGGLFLAMVSAVMLPWSFWSGWRGELVGVRDPDSWLAWGVGGLTAVTVINWLIEVAI